MSHHLIQGTRTATKSEGDKFKKYQRTQIVKPEKRCAATDLNIKDARITRNKRFLMKISAMCTHKITANANENHKPPFDMSDDAVHCAVQGERTRIARDS